MTTGLSNKIAEYERDERHNNVAETRYWCDQWHNLAVDFYGRLEELNKLCKYHEKIEEELQQKIVEQQALIDEVSKKARSWMAGNLDADIAMFQFARRVEEKLYDDLSALAAHDAKLAAEAKAEALEEGAAHITREYGPNSMKTSRHAAAEELLEKAAEYRAKAKVE